MSTELSLWNRCSKLTESGNWKPSAGFPNRIERGITWARWPHRYALRETRPAHVPPQAYIASTFLLKSLSAETDIGTLELSEYVIRKQGLVAVHKANVPPIDKITPAFKAEYERSLNFMMQNGLYAPNDGEIQEVQEIIGLGEMDGFEVYDQ